MAWSDTRSKFGDILVKSLRTYRWVLSAPSELWCDACIRAESFLLPSSGSFLWAATAAELSAGRWRKCCFRHRPIDGLHPGSCMDGYVDRCVALDSGLRMLDTGREATGSHLKPPEATRSR